MTTKDIAMLKKLAREAEIEVIEYPDGRIVLIGGMVPVHWWPLSKRRTAYCDCAPKGHSYVTAKQVVSLAVNGRLA
jgi:hypothetical protein